ncbi:MAG: hypothetical protein ABMB14_30640 [Myxococcota bacterium]
MPTFLLSPADCRGKRAAMLVRDEATFPLAVELRAGRASLGAVFSFVSGLYFRGKLAYARRFGGVIRVIVPGRGLLDPDLRLATDHVHAFGAVEVDPDDPAYRNPLIRDARDLAADPRVDRIVLLGSLATPKYVAPLSEVLGDRLWYPTALAGQGDMKRGKLLLDAASTGIELGYAPIGPAG